MDKLTQDPSIHELLFGTSGAVNIPVGFPGTEYTARIVLSIAEGHYSVEHVMMNTSCRTWQPNRFVPTVPGSQLGAIPIRYAETQKAFHS
jgi:hypothetical protein